MANSTVAPGLAFNPFARNGGGRALSSLTSEHLSKFIVADRQTNKTGPDPAADLSAAEKFITGFMLPLHAWCTERADQVAACCVRFAPSRASLTVYVIPSGGYYDFTLSADLAELDVKLSDFISFGSVLQIPVQNEDELSSFVPDETSTVWVYNGKPEAAPREV